MTPNIISWIAQQLPRLDTPDAAQKLIAFRDLDRMMQGRMKYAELAGIVRQHRPPHLELTAPVNAQTVGRLLEDELDQVPLANQLWLGDLQRRLRRGDQPTDADTKRVRAIRRVIAGAAA
jgi:hypothetical protein